MAALEEAFTTAIAASKIEGAVISARSRNGRYYSKLLGHRTLPDGTKKEHAASDMLYLASATKLPTALAALQCCEKGFLSLDEDLSVKWAEIKNLRARGVMVKNDDGSSAEKDGELITEAVTKPLTLRHLLSHSSGLVYHFFNPALNRWREKHFDRDTRPMNAAIRFSQPLAFQPGEGWMYGPGIDIAGWLVEEVSGLTLQEYFRRHLLAPVGVEYTELSFFPVRDGFGERMPDLNPKDPHGHGLSVNGGVPMDGDDSCYGGHGGYCTADAYVAFLHSILVDDEKILSKESVKEMFKPQLEPLAHQNFNALLSNPATAIFGQGTGSPNRDWGVSGLLVQEDGDASGVGKGSLTWGGGLNSVWVIDPLNGVCGFAAPQMGLPPDVPKATELKGVFRKELKNVFD